MLAFSPVSNPKVVVSIVSTNTSPADGPSVRSISVPGLRSIVFDAAFDTCVDVIANPPTEPSSASTFLTTISPSGFTWNLEELISIFEFEPL